MLELQRVWIDVQNLKYLIIRESEGSQSSIAELKKITLLHHSPGKGHDWGLQTIDSFASPSQGAPPFEGGVHVRDLVFVPDPQLFEQAVHWPHSDHLPSMAKSERNQEKDKLKVDAIISNYCSNSKISAAPLWDVEAQKRKSYQSNF